MRDEFYDIAADRQAGLKCPLRVVDPIGDRLDAMRQAASPRVQNRESIQPAHLPKVKRADEGPHHAR
jgi:hypothetical protein